MALKKSITTKTGIVAPNAYHRIKSVKGENDGSIWYYVDIYLDEAARDAKMRPLDTKAFQVPDDIKSKIGIIIELYNILKLNPSYADSEDVIEENPISGKIGDVISNTFVMDATLSSTDGISYSEESLSGVAITGSVIIDQFIVYGVFNNANLDHISWDGEKISKCFMHTGVFVSGLAKQMLF
jgi:hypothetical protein